jgi:hypothetical protein
MKNQPSIRELRRFACTVGAGLAIIGALSRYRGHIYPPTVLWIIAAVLLLLGLVRPSSLAAVQKSWLGLANILGWINTRVILSLLFYFVLTPLSLIMRFFRDPLDRRLHETRNSYWLSKKSQRFDPKNYERQF